MQRHIWNLQGVDHLTFEVNGVGGEGTYTEKKVFIHNHCLEKFSHI